MLVEKDDKLVVVSSLKKDIWLVIGAIFLIAWCILCLTSKDTWIIEKIAWIIGIPFFGYGTIILIKRIITRNELVVVDKNWITDNSSAVSIWFIPWNDISNIEIKSTETQKFNSLLTPQSKETIENQKFISVSLYNEEKYLEQIPQWKRMLLLSNKQLGLGIVNITLVGTGVDINEFYEKIIEYIKLKKLNIHIWPKEEQTSII